MQSMKTRRSLLKMIGIGLAVSVIGAPSLFADGMSALPLYDVDGQTIFPYYPELPTLEGQRPTKYVSFRVSPGGKLIPVEVDRSLFEEKYAH